MGLDAASRFGRQTVMRCSKIRRADCLQPTANVTPLIGLVVYISSSLHAFIFSANSQQLPGEPRRAFRAISSLPPYQFRYGGLGK
jgi:hypothetical protein